MADEFLAMLNEYHSLPEIWDNQLDSQIHKWYVDPPKVWPQKPYFSPSSAGSSLRELYLKQIGAKKDNERRPAHQKRWTSVGTAVGDMIQRDLLFIEKHFKAKTGKTPAFIFERNDKGEPMFEDFAATNAAVKHKGFEFNLYGMPDGVMSYTDEKGTVHRIGLEIKSKQTTYSRTSDFSMKAPENKHVKQTVAYSHMYRDPDSGQPLDYYLILYVNLSKKGWFASFDEAPDLKCFGVEITEADREELFDYLTQVLSYVEKKELPPFDIDNWTFNNFKTATALSLTDEEFEDAKQFVKRALKSNLPEYKKGQYFETFEDIKERRGCE